MKAPLKITINYLSNIRDIVLYTSWKNPDPNHHDHHGCYKNHTRVLISNGIQNDLVPTFIHKYLYLSFTSVHGNLIRVNVKFNVKEKNTQNSTVINENKNAAAESSDKLFERRIANTMMSTINEMNLVDDKEHESRWTQGKKAKLNSLADDPFHYQAFTMVMDKVKERAISNKRKAQNDNFVKKNMYLIKFWNEYEFERRRRHQDVNQTNHETALKRKELILRFKREKVESLKRIKEQMKIEEQKKRRLINLITSWITIMQQHKAVKMGHSKYQEKNLKIFRLRVRLRTKFRMYYKYKRNSRKKGKTMDIRMIKDIKMSCNYLAMVGEVKRQSAAMLISDFLTKTVLVKVITLKMIRTYYRLNKLAKFCKENYSKNEGKKKVLNYLWETELANLMIKFRNSSSVEENKKEDQLLNILPKQRENAINEYLDRCKLRHANLYYEWRKRYNETYENKIRHDEISQSFEKITQK